jgi:predicted ATP-grasp superfamily ATP-dependent carboligase
LFPTDDEAAGLVARRRDELSTVYRVLSSSWDIVETASDKRRTYRLAADLGVPHPRTFVPADAGELRDAELEFPVILKPAMKTVANAFTDAKAWPAEDRPQLLALYEQAVRLVPPDLVMIQELVPGDGSGQLSFAALCVEGEVLASLVVRRTRQFPVDFGHSSSFVESVVDDEVEALGRLVLGRMGFTGLVEAEFKRSPGDCRPRLLDINPRVWTWHSIGRRAGVDFPYLAWRTVHGDPPAGVRGRAGARWARPATDVFAARAAVGAGTLTWSRYLRQVLPPAELAPWLATDPLPALADLPLLAVRTGRRVRANHAQSREVRAARAGAAWGAPTGAGRVAGPLLERSRG